MYIYIHTYIHTYVCIYIHIYTYICIFVYNPEYPYKTNRVRMQIETIYIIHTRKVHTRTKQANSTLVVFVCLISWLVVHRPKRWARAHESIYDKYINNPYKILCNIAPYLLSNSVPSFRYASKSLHLYHTHINNPYKLLH